VTLAVYWHFLRLRLRERLEYRGAFLIGLVSQGLGYAADFTVMWILIHRFGSLGGWHWEAIAFLYSLNLMSYAIGAAFTYSPMTELETMVQRGTFDGVLVRPLNPYASLTAEKFNVGYLGHILIALGILIWSINQLTIDWTVGRMVFLVAALIGASLIQAAILTLLGAWSFTFVRAQFLFGFAGSLRTFVTYPITIYGTAIQVVLTAIVPFAFVNFYPASVLLGKDGQFFPEWVGWLTPLVGLAAFALAYKVWMRGVNRYQGAGG
jgi:ABC-2 type transport system permease protein